MTKNEFKQGDRVRFVGDYDHYVEDVLEKDTEYTVVDADMCGCDLAVQCTAYSVSGEDLELVEPYNRRTAFLTELQALLRKYDARIYDEDEYKVIIDLDIHCEKGERIECMGTDGEVNADNIMDFDKEGV